MNGLLSLLKSCDLLTQASWQITCKQKGSTYTHIKTESNVIIDGTCTAVGVKNWSPTK